MIILLVLLVMHSQDWFIFLFFLQILYILLRLRPFWYQYMHIMYLFQEQKTQNS